MPRKIDYNTMTEEEVAKHKEERRIAKEKRKEYMANWRKENKEKHREMSLKCYYKKKFEFEPEFYIKKHEKVIKMLKDI
jgi:hypothetical protein